METTPPSLAFPPLQWWGFGLSLKITGDNQISAPSSWTARFRERGPCVDWSRPEGWLIPTQCRSSGEGPSEDSGPISGDVALRDSTSAAAAGKMEALILVGTGGPVPPSWCVGGPGGGIP